MFLISTAGSIYQCCHRIFRRKKFISLNLNVFNFATNRPGWDALIRHIVCLIVIFCFELVLFRNIQLKPGMWKLDITSKYYLTFLFEVSQYSAPTSLQDNQLSNWRWYDVISNLSQKGYNDVVPAGPPRALNDGPVLVYTIKCYIQGAIQPRKPIFN